MPDIARGMIRHKPDVFVTDSTPATRAAMQVSSSIPIIMTAPGDPIGAGLVKSLSRPGANVTGLSLMAPEVSVKRMELLKELFPSLKRVGVMWDPGVPWHKAALETLEQNARRSAIELIPVSVAQPSEIAPALTALHSAHAGALCVLDSAFLLAQRRALVRAVARSRLPAIYPEGHFVREGGLIAYSADSVDLFRRSARYVAQVLRGVNAGDLPVEQPTKFLLSLNVKTAIANQVTFPKALLERADEVVK